MDIILVRDDHQESTKGLNKGDGNKETEESQQEDFDRRHVGREPTIIVCSYWDPLEMHHQYHAKMLKYGYLQ